MYERQWEVSGHSSAAIQDYLSKVNNLGLVLRECLVTVADNADDVEELVKFGLAKAREGGAGRRPRSH